MKLRIEVYVPQLDMLLNFLTRDAGPDRETCDRLDKIVEEIKHMGNVLDTKLSALEDAVAAETSVTQSAVTLITGLAEQLQTAIDDAKNSGATDVQLAALDSLAAKIVVSSAALSDAIAANTPAAPAPAPADPVV